MIEKQLHRVDFKRNKDKEGGHTLIFTCLGDETSKCHQYPDCSCELWDDDHEHPKASHADCWLVSWFENDGQGTSYVGNDTIEICRSCCDGYCPPKSRKGFIKTVFNEEWVEWEWMK